MKSLIRNLIDSNLEKLSKELSVSLPEDFVYDIHQPKKKEHGDVSCNVAFRMAKLAKVNPVEMANKTKDIIKGIVDKNKDLKSSIERIEVAGPGFLNFHLSSMSLVVLLKQIWSESDKFGTTTLGKGKKVIIEYVSANPTGPLTIAHGRQAVVGDVLANLLMITGHEVCREYYLNDRGLQIQLLGKSVYTRYLELLNVDVEFPEAGYQGSYIKDLAQVVLDNEGERFKDVSEEEACPFFSEFAATKILDEIKVDLKDSRCEFDAYFSERSLDDDDLIKKVIERLKSLGVAYDKDGAVWLKSTQYGDDKDRVLIKSSGEYTYLTPDIAYHEKKFDRGFDSLINLWGPDHHGYIARLKAACEALGHDSKQLNILLVQLTTLFRAGEPVRMSTRAGEFVTLRELIDDVGVDATRFFFLMRRIESHLDFDLELAKQKSQENPVYYVQYAHARIASILRSAEVAFLEKVDLNLINQPEELEVIKHLSNLPEVLNQAAEFLEPYRVSEYLRELATKFHKFYTLHRVINDDDVPLTQSRLFLIACIQRVLKNGLSVLGVDAPEKM